MNLKLTLLVIWRKLKHNRIFSMLNISGLGIGISVAVIVFLYTDYELSFDRFYKDSDNIYLAVDNEQDVQSVLPVPFSETLKNEIPEVKEAANFLPWQIRKKMTTDKGSFSQVGYYMDEAVFSLFGIQIIQQSQDKIFPDANSVSISESLADKMYGSAAMAIGKNVLMDNQKSCTISAVFKDIPKNSTIGFELAFPLRPSLKELNIEDSWNQAYVSSFVKLDRTPGSVKQKQDSFIKKHDWGFTLFPLVKIHFAQKGSEQKKTLFIAIIAGMFIMLLASINFINLSTAHIINRTTEAGIYKLFGSSSAQLHRQFLIESIMLTLVAFIISLGVTAALLPVINRLLGTALSLRQLNIGRWTLLISIIVGVMLLTAFIPANIFSRAQPVSILTKQISKGRQAVLLRKGLLLLQLSVTLVIIIITFFIGRQVHFINSTSLGFDKKNMVYIETDDIFKIAKGIPYLKAELLKNPYITSFSAVDAPPGIIGTSTSGFSWNGLDPKQSYQVYMLRVSDDFLKTFRINLLQGNDLDNHTDYQDEVLVNQTLASLVSEKGSATGEILTYHKSRYEIKGVVNDFAFNSIKEKQSPCVIIYSQSRGFYPCIRFSDNASMPGVMASINKSMKQIFPDMEYQVKYTNDFIMDSFLARETRLSGFFSILSILGIIVCSLGLSGLALFESTKRVKEIGIRKVNGARITEILAMLNKEFVGLVISAFIIATPVSWFILQKWLENFSYRTSLSWWIFALAGMLAMVIELLTVSWQSWKAATRNPVEALRYE